jgi:hypothetical protein
LAARTQRCSLKSLHEASGCRSRALILVLCGFFSGRY